MEQYQDIWVRGKVKSKGVRDCESRWETIKEIASRWSRPFTVLDVGANLGYFSLRLAEEFDCTVVAVEGMYGDWLQSILEENANPRVLFLRRNMSVRDLKRLADVEHFDLTLALSVVHHFGGPFDKSVDVLRSMGDVLLLEMANEAGACGQGIVKDSQLPDDAEIVGWGPSHVGGPGRPIAVLEQEKSTLRRAYMGTPLKDVDLEIRSSYESKTVVQRGETRDWYRGINLRTWLNTNGSYPSRTHIRRLLLDARPDGVHGDLKAHNTILQGDAVQFVDRLDPRRVVEPDDLRFQELLEEVGG